MTPYRPARCVAELVKVLPLPADCDRCDPNGGCGEPMQCLTDLAQTIMDVIELEAMEGKP